MADRIVAALLSAPATLGRGRLLAIDGPAGSGKTTLAGAVAAGVHQRGCSAEIVRLDDLYDGWRGLEPDRASGLERRILAQLLRPLAAGRAARWQAYDWTAEEFGDWRTTEPTDVLVLEGCGAGALAYAAYLTVLVWVEAVAQVRAERMVVRDGEQVRAHLPAWTTSEEEHFARNWTRSRADLHLTT